MYNIILESQARISINKFIQGYLKIFENLFFDSGIDNLDLIEENYYRNAIDLRDKFYKEIITAFSSELIGKHISDSGLYYAVLTIGNFRLFVYYTEEDNTRYIEDIEFFRK